MSVPLDIYRSCVPEEPYGYHLSNGTFESSIDGQQTMHSLSFTISAPMKKLTYEDRHTFGNCSVDTNYPVVHTLVFSSSWIIRLAGRKVKLEARYERISHWHVPIRNKVHRHFSHIQRDIGFRPWLPSICTRPLNLTHHNNFLCIEKGASWARIPMNSCI